MATPGGRSKARREDAEFPFHTPLFHLFSPILNPPLLMLPEAVASQVFPPRLSTANGDVHFASPVYQTASQLPCVAPAFIPPPTAPGAWGCHWRCCSKRQPGRKKGILFFFPPFLVLFSCKNFESWAINRLPVCAGGWGEE